MHIASSAFLIYNQEKSGYLNLPRLRKRSCEYCAVRWLNCWTQKMRESIENTGFPRKMSGIYLNRSPLLNPVTPDLKVGIFHLTAGSRKELRFVLNRSFHVQLSVWLIAIVKVNIFVQNLLQLLRCFVKMMVEGFFF